jgi:hypothetical protein
MLGSRSSKLLQACPTADCGETMTVVKDGQHYSKVTAEDKATRKAKDACKRGASPVGQNSSLVLQAYWGCAAATTPPLGQQRKLSTSLSALHMSLSLGRSWQGVTKGHIMARNLQSHSDWLESATVTTIPRNNAYNAYLIFHVIPILWTHCWHLDSE